MTEAIRVFLQTQVQDNSLPQIGLLHPKAAMFKRSANKVAGEIVKNDQ